MELVEAFVIMSIVVAGLAAWRVGQRVPARDLLMVARATGSPRACLGYIWFCTRF